MLGAGPPPADELPCRILQVHRSGDSYMAVGGVPLRQEDHAERVAKVALDMIPTIEQLGRSLDLPRSPASAYTLATWSQG